MTSATGTLCTWLGNSDIKEAKNWENGPVLSSIKKNNYRKLLLLSCLKDPEDTKVFIEWTKRNHSVEIFEKSFDPTTDPTDFETVYRLTNRALTEFTDQEGTKDNLTFLINPGTQVMGAVWIILSASLFPAALIQAQRQSGVKEVVIPFEVVSDYAAGKAKEIIRAVSNSIANTDADEMFGDFEWRSLKMKEAIDRAKHIAGYDDIPVLIIGRSGTGKEEMADFIHRCSGRRHKVRESINCAAIPATLIESELFGAEKGAYTGATTRLGVLERTDGGTLFLDEIGDMLADAQVKLLRALQQKEFRKVGGNSLVKSDFRLICATNRPLTEDLASGRFREDLFYRVAGGVITLPPLVERRDDIVPFAEAQLRIINRTFSANPLYCPKKLGNDSRRVLLEHHWPGNLRELISVLKSAAVWGKNESLTADDLTATIFKTDTNGGNLLLAPLGGDFNINDLLQQVKERYIQRALQSSGNNASVAARLLGVTPQTFFNWQKKRGS